MSLSNAFDILKERGFIRQVTDEAAVRALFDAGPVTCYIGFDPTADSLHVGSLIPIMALVHLQRAGHRPIAVVGGGTARVGDPSGRTELRQMLSPQDLRRNADKIHAQLGRYLDFGDRALAVDNADWLLNLNYIDFLRDIGRHFSVNRMLAAEAYKIRMETGLSFLEFNYQILQAYDFLVLHRKYGCLLQMGGDDQWGNILAGTELIRRVEGADAQAATFPLITNASGQKMGKTAAGAVWLAPDRLSPYEFYQYWINTDDRDVERFLGLYTLLPTDEVRRLSQLQGADLRQAKEALAYETTKLTHGEAEAQEARKKSQAAFGKGSDDSNMPAVEIPRDMVDDTLTATVLFTHVLSISRRQEVSRGEARRLIQQGGAYLNGQRIDDANRVVSHDLLNTDTPVLQAGKKIIYRVVIKA
ncbi:MAG: tyrosine--tRNA ligase [Candidatus Latescibacteria bacterium]|nr:tyrosine--tRNA ligase [Candidatus Latescibacterota bacterium]